MAVADYDTCFHGSLVDEIIAMLMNVIALTIIIRIGVVARKRLSSDAKMHLQLEILFYIAIIAACLVQIGSILSVALCPFQGSVVQLFIFLFVVYYGFILLFACLTATLIIRLYLTFQHSAWKISRNKLIVSIFLTMVMCLIWMSAAIIRWIGWIETKMFFGLTGMGWILFMFLSVESAYYFIRNLLALAGLRGSTRDTTANAKQQKFINVSSKYMILFVMAVCTSTAVTIMSALSRITLDIHPGIGWSIDCVINVLCLYLQYSFAAHHYRKYCSKLECCRSRMTDNVRMQSIASNSRSKAQVSSKDSAVIVYDQSVSPSCSPKSVSQSPASETDCNLS